ncbi:sensor histidine kinase [Deinococcus ficus]|uniref:sensor histidine kinase n=1 Tax=Deinococcus ficus TaxID=317577 RepID=UPI0003B337AF|nr:ATP-binding protein [Deinococcus ficus]
MPLPLTVLSRRLQDITETLASATTEEAVFDVVLYPAMTALNATAATVLLRSGNDQELHVVASVGYDRGQPSIWQSALTEDDGPAADALRRKEPLFFERDRDLAQAYPNVERRTGAVSPVAATAVLPMFLDDRPLGVLVVDFQEPYTFTDDERWFLNVLAAQCAIAFGRARLLRSLEAQVAARTDSYLKEQDKLQLANDDLEAFSYSVSHDLRTPVRHISAFSQLLRKSSSECLDEPSRRYLQLIEDSATRMNTLIDAMLDLSRTSVLPLRSESVDLGALVNRARRDLELDTEDRTVQWNVGALPVVRGDPETLQQVMTNLLSNAVKYTRNEAVTHVRVWAEDQGEMWLISVQDNGVGFDARYADKLFGVFKRLHRPEDFEGTGVGLANVQRIVRRHGGEVWAQGSVGSGATFQFTLPKTP